MKAIFLYCLTTLLLFAHMIDLGTQGEVYEITEKPLQKQIEEGIADINYTKAKEEFLAEVEAMYSFEHKLTSCKEDFNSSVPNEVIAPYDILDQHGQVVFATGQKIPYTLPAGISFSLCFIDGSADVEGQLKALDQTAIECEIAVANADSRILSQKYSRTINPLNQIILSRVEIPCYPSIVTFIGSEIKYFTLRAIKEEVK